MRSVLAVLLILAVADGQDSFFEDGYEKRPDHRILEFNPMSHGYGEASRQIVALQSINNREFEKHRERHRSSPKDWGLGDALEKNAVFKGELSCHKMIGSDELNDLTAVENYGVFKVKSVKIIDEETGEQYPYIREGDDFIAYNPDLKHVHDRRYIKVQVRHVGCVPLEPGCTAVSTYVSSFKNAYHHQMGFNRMNLAVKYYEQECSFLRRVFNFWPFN